MSLYELLGGIRVAGEREQVECPCIEGADVCSGCAEEEADASAHDRDPIHGAGCIVCKGVNYVVNPKFVPMLRVVRADCQGQDLRDAPTYHGKRYLTGESCCDGTLFITRHHHWEGAGEGELEGALVKAVSHIIRHGRSRERWSRCYNRLLSLLAQEGDTRVAACQEVLEALRAQHKARSASQGVR